MRKLLFTLLCSSCLLFGCSKEELTYYSDDAKTLQLPIKTAGNVEITIPKELDIIEEDGQSFWKLSDGTTILLKANCVPVGDGVVGNCVHNDANVYYEIPNDLGYVQVNTEEHLIPYWCESLNDLDLHSGVYLKDQLCTIDNKLGKLPKYEECDMTLVESNNLYMPKEYKNTVIDMYTACYYNVGSQFVESWVMYYKLDDLLPMLLSKVVCNSKGNINVWYQDSDVLYLETDRYVIGAKKLTYNQWCCYMSSNTPDMKNYLLQGLHKIHYDK